MKIIALMPVKNEEWILRTAIPQLRRFADEILALYTPSTDRTAEILRSFGIQVKEQPYYPVNYSLWRQMLLDWGRQRGGTHFIWLDADEAFTTNLLPEFRDTVNRLKPSQKLALRWLCLWKDSRKYRRDRSVWSELYKDFVFCDDRVSGFGEGAAIHEGRTPGRNTPDNWVKLPLEKGAVLHFQFVSSERFQMKQAFQRCRELSLGNRGSPAVINAKYSITMDDEKAVCADIPQDWLEGIEGLDELKTSGVGWYYDSIKDFFKDKGIGYYEKLQIWHIPQLNEEFVSRIGRQPKPAVFNPLYRLAKQALVKIYNAVFSTSRFKPVNTTDIREFIKKVPLIGRLLRIIFDSVYAGRDAFYKILINISLARYHPDYVLTRQHVLSIPTVQTTGDALLHYHYTKLLAREQKRPVFCLSPDTWPSNVYLPFLFSAKEYAFYSEPCYNFFTRFFKKSRIDHLMLEALKQRFKKYNPLRFYQKHYDKANDPVYRNIPDKKSGFCRAYLAVRKNDNKIAAMTEYNRLLREFKGDFHRLYLGYSDAYYEECRRKIGLTDKYVCLHIRLYAEKGPYAYDPAKETDPRGIYSLESYLSAVQFLIKKGYQVVRMGTSDNRCFPAISGLLDYANSGYQNIINDLYVSSGCRFFIGSKSGAEMFAALFQKPLLGLNYVCLNSMLGIPYLRFWPKRIVDHQGRSLAVSQWLDHEIYFSQGPEAYNRNRLRTAELTAEEILEAVEEMLHLTENPDVKWNDLTQRQRGFRGMVRPEHLDLFNTAGAPCDVYLARAGL